jgi:ABC-type branched-subunit amino acid transport system ATPase component
MAKFKYLGMTVTYDGKRPFENLAKFEHLRTAATNQNDIHEEIKSQKESSTSQSTIQKHKDENVQYYNYTHCFLWVECVGLSH